MEFKRCSRSCMASNTSNDSVSSGLVLARRRWTRSGQSHPPPHCLSMAGPVSLSVRTVRTEPGAKEAIRVSPGTSVPDAKKNTLHGARAGLAAAEALLNRDLTVRSILLDCCSLAGTHGMNRLPDSVAAGECRRKLQFQGGDGHVAKGLVRDSRS